MVKLIAYSQLSTDDSISGILVKAQCEFCGKKFGSVEEARKCESGHIMDLIKEEYKYGR